MKRLILSESIAAELHRHATSSPETEVCGILAGDGNGLVQWIFPLANRGGPLDFFADPYEQFQAEREIERQGLSILAIYHTHPDGSATLSPGDVLFAAGWDCAHLVIAVDCQRNVVREMRAYRVSSCIISEVEVVIATNSFVGE